MCKFFYIIYWVCVEIKQVNAKWFRTGTVFIIARASTSRPCLRHRHSGTWHLSPVPERSGIGLGYLFPVLDYPWQAFLFIPVRTGPTGCRKVRHFCTSALLTANRDARPHCLLQRLIQPAHVNTDDNVDGDITHCKCPNSKRGKGYSPHVYIAGGRKWMHPAQKCTSTLLICGGKGYTLKSTLLVVETTPMSTLMTVDRDTPLRPHCWR